MSKESTEAEHQCTFCDKDKKDVIFLIASHNDTYICDECVELCTTVANDRKIKEEKEKTMSVETDGMDQIILNQADTPHERARKLLQASGLAGHHFNDMAYRMSESVEIYMRLDGIIKHEKLGEKDVS